MIEPPFQVGEIVYLKSGSPAMTVVLIIAENKISPEYIRTSWMADRDMRSSRFPPETLTRKKPKFKFGADEVVTLKEDRAFDE